MIRPEAGAITAYLRICDAGLAGKYFMARYATECLVTHTAIRPSMQVVAVGDHGYARRDALEWLNVRGNDTVDTILARFAWPSHELLAKWVAQGSTVTLLTASTLKPKVVRERPRLGSFTLDTITPLYFRSVAFMVRTDA